MINCHFVWPVVHMPERGRETRLVPMALSSFISIREVYYLWLRDTHELILWALIFIVLKSSLIVFCIEWSGYHLQSTV